MENKYVSESNIIISDIDDDSIFHKSIKFYTDNSHTPSQCINEHLKEIYNKTSRIDIYNKFKISFSFKSNYKAIEIPKENSSDIIKILDTIILENHNKTEFIIFFYIINNPDIIKYKTVYTKYSDDIEENIYFYKENINKNKQYDLIFNLSGKFNYECIDKLIEKIRNFAKFVSN